MVLSTAARLALAALVVLAGCIDETQPVAPTAPPDSPDLGVAQLTGGVGNKVVASFDQIRAGVRGVQAEIDRCYVSTSDEGGWRENLMWDLEVSDRGTVVAVAPYVAEYHRGDRIVPGVAGARLEGCMERALGEMVLPGPVTAGSIRVRFET
jgi:hypothetical protein